MPTLLETTLFAFGVMVLVALFFFASGCAQVPATPTITRVVCIQPDVEFEPAVRAIEWWGEPFVLACPGEFTVQRGGAPGEKPFAAGWTDYDRKIVVGAGDTFTIVRHEWGHVLGYGHSLGSAMSSTSFTDWGGVGRTTTRGTW